MSIKSQDARIKKINVRYEAALRTGNLTTLASKTF